MFSNDIYDVLGNLPQNRKIGIWGLTSKSFMVLAQAINSRIRIEYFVDIEGNYDGAPVFDKEIITKQELKEQTDIFTIICKEHYFDDKEWIETYLQKNYYVWELGAVREEIKKSSSIYIYGAGYSGKKTLQVFKSQNIEIKGFIDSDERKWGKEWCNYPIHGKNILDKDDVIVISSLCYFEIQKDLKQNSDNKNIYIDYRNSKPGLEPIYYKDNPSIWIQFSDGKLLSWANYLAVFYTVIWNDIQNKEVIFYGNNIITKQAIEILDLLGIQTKYIVDDEDDIGNINDLDVKDVYDLAYENMANKIVLITKIDKENTEKYKTPFFDSGKKLKELNMKYYKDYRVLTYFYEAIVKVVHDRLLNDMFVYEKTLEHPGLYCFKKDKCRKRIIILGGSTSNPAIYENVIKGWPEYLSYKYDDIEVISAAISGRFSTDECLKLLRDVGQLKPDLVISYSGVNEISTKRKKNHPFHWDEYIPDVYYGVENDAQKSDFWILMERYMKAICEVNGSDFIGVLQPALTLKETRDLSPFEKRLKIVFDNDNDLMREYFGFTEEVKVKMKNYDWMYDLTAVFSGIRETVYFDSCHLTDKGNQIIADRIYDIINDYYAKRGEKF